MKLMTLAVAAVAMTFAQSAQARAHHHYRHHYSHEARRYQSRPDYWAWGDDRGWSEASDDQPVERRGYGREARRYQTRHDRWRWREDRQWSQTSDDRPMERSGYGGGYGPRPGAWCGWEMRQLVGSDPGPSYNLARNWAHWGHAGPAGVGAVVVWSHHVGKIVGQADGEWVIESGNDGHRIRTRPRSIAGAIAIRWG